jgi:acyl-ACP thioesterase
MKYRKELSTRSFFINRFGQMSTSFMFYQMQDIAWEHADVLGLGYNQLKKERQFWVLSRLLVKIGRRPTWGEDFTLVTWSRGTDGFWAYRDYNFIDRNGNIIVQATSSWLVLGQATKKIIRLADIEGFPTFSESVLGVDASKIKAPKSEAELSFSPVLFNEIDINQHFNTGRYLERIIDAYNFDFHENFELAELEVNFLKEGLPNDFLAVRKECVNELDHICSVVRQSDAIDLVRAKLKWKKR